MRFWSKVEPRDATGELRRADRGRAGRDRTADRAGRRPAGRGQADRAARRRVRPADAVARPARRGPGGAERTRWSEHWQRLTDAGARPAGSWAFEALRVEALRPRLGVDTDERTIPHEVNWLEPAVHLDKGCYRGQETVAKVANIGRPPRRMVLLHLDGSQEVLPVTGEPVLLGERVVGRVGFGGPAPRTRPGRAGAAQAVRPGGRRTAGRRRGPRGAGRRRPGLGAAEGAAPGREARSARLAPRLTALCEYRGQCQRSTAQTAALPPARSSRSPPPGPSTPRPTCRTCR